MLPTTPLAFAVPVSTGGGISDVISRSPDAVPTALLAVIVPVKTPVAASVPETNPVVMFKERPGARPLAPNAVGKLVALI